MSEHPDNQPRRSSDEPTDRSAQAHPADPVDPAGQQARVDSRAELLPEERAAGSENPEQQAEAILAESDARTDHPVATQQQSVQSPDVDPERLAEEGLDPDRTAQDRSS